MAEPAQNLSDPQFHALLRTLSGAATKQTPASSPLPVSPLAAGGGAEGGAETPAEVTLKRRPATTYTDFTRPAKPQVPRGLRAKQFLQGETALEQVHHVSDQISRYVRDRTLYSIPVWRQLHWQPELDADVRRVFFAHWFSLVQIVFQQLGFVYNPAETRTTPKSQHQRLRDMLSFFGTHVWPNYLQVADASAEWLRQLVANGSIAEVDEVYFDENRQLLISAGMRLPTGSEYELQHQLEVVSTDLATVRAANIRARDAIGDFFEKVLLALNDPTLRYTGMPADLATAIGLLYRYVNALVERLSQQRPRPAEPRDTPMADVPASGNGGGGLPPTPPPSSDELARLRRDLDAAHRDRDTAVAQLSDATGRIKNLEDTIRGNSALIADYQRDYPAEQARAARAEERADKAEQELAPLRIRAEQVDGVLAASRTENEQLRKLMADLQAQLDAAKRTGDDKDRQLAATTRERDEKNRQLVATSTERDQLNQSLRECQIRLNAIQDARTTQETEELLTLRQRLQAAEAQNTYDVARAVAAEREVDELRPLLERRTAELAQSATIPASLLTAIGALRAKIEELRTINEQLQKASSDQTGELRGRLATQETEAADLRARAQRWETVAGEFLTAKENAEKSLAEIGKQLARAKRTVTLQTAKVAETQRLLDSRTSQLAQATTMPASLLTAVGKLREKIDVLTLENKKVGELQSQNAAYEQSLREANTELTRATMTLEALREEANQRIAELNNALTNCQQSLLEHEQLLVRRTTELAQAVTMPASLLTAVGALRRRIEEETTMKP